jgi:hypothetical protein
MYRYLGQYIDTSGLNNHHFTIILIIDGIDASTAAIVSMSMSQPITSMALSQGHDDTIDDASMAEPLPYSRHIHRKTQNYELAAPTAPYSRPDLPNPKDTTYPTCSSNIAPA